VTEVVPEDEPDVAFAEHPVRESAAAAARAITPKRSFRFGLRDIIDPSFFL